MDEEKKGIVVQAQEEDKTYNPITEALTLGNVEWKSTGLTKADEDPINGYPVVTHEGIITLRNLELKVCQLSNGMRIIPEEDLRKFLIYMSEEIV